MDENNQKIFYLLSIIFETTKFENIEEYQLLLSLLTCLICDDDNRKETRKRRSKKGTLLSSKLKRIDSLPRTRITVTETGKNDGVYRRLRPC
jgi:hypothetical protein